MTKVAAPESSPGQQHWFSRYVVPLLGGGVLLGLLTYFWPVTPPAAAPSIAAPAAAPAPSPPPQIQIINNVGTNTQVVTPTQPAPTASRAEPPRPQSTTRTTPRSPSHPATSIASPAPTSSVAAPPSDFLRDGAPVRLPLTNPQKVD